MALSFSASAVSEIYIPRYLVLCGMSTTGRFCLLFKAGSPLGPSLLLGVRWLATTVGACLVTGRGLIRCGRSVILWVITLCNLLYLLIKYLAEYRKSA